MSLDIGVSVTYSREITGNATLDYFLLNTRILSGFAKPFRKIIDVRFVNCAIVSDINFLSSLTSVETLCILFNEVHNLEPLKNLTHLKSLSLHDNHVVDLSPLSDLKKLRVLELSENQITDLTPIAGLKNLTDLYLRNNQITDLKPLYGLFKLKEITLSDNPNLTVFEINKFQKALPGCKIKKSAFN